MSTTELREIRFNYTSADDCQVVRMLLGAEAWAALEGLRARRVVVNTERLDRILGVEERDVTLPGGRAARAHVMRVEAGVVTERAMEEAERRGLVFATDPTSAWACTIGGNVSENAGGKSAVRYGTCIDNLLAWTTAMPGGTFTVRRLDHPLRKILPGDTVRWQVEDTAGRAVRTIALAARTNAFKLNEDIVLPLEAFAEFSRWVDTQNLEEERENQVELARRLRDFFEAASPLEDPDRLGGKIARAIDLCEETVEALSWEGSEQLRGGAAVEGPIAELRGLVRGYPELVAGIEGIVRHVRSRLVVLATHMHAGDGNVHVNIPVMSNDRAMLRRAAAAVDRLMAKTAALGGACSGEHGIGVTKLKYLDPALREALAAYRRVADPGGLMNPGKLEDLAAIELIFTPSFSLLETVLERDVLAAHRFKRTALATRATLWYLESTSNASNRLFHSGVLVAGSAAQRLAARALRRLRRDGAKGAGSLFGSPLRAPDPVGMRELLPACDADQALVVEPAGAAPRHIAVELARALSGPGWMEMLRSRVANAQAVRF